MAPQVKSVKVYAVIESVIEPPCSAEELHVHLREGRFGGSTTVNYNQGGVTNTVTREHIPVTMRELDALLETRKNGQ